MKKTILIFIAFILCIGTFACDETPAQTSEESSKAQQAINTESIEQQSTTDSLYDQSSESSKVTQVSSETSESISEANSYENSIENYDESNTSQTSIETSETNSIETSIGDIDVSNEPEMPNENFFAVVKEIEDDAIIVDYNTFSTIIKFRVICTNADEFCKNDNVIIAYNGEVDQKLGDNYYEITATAITYEVVCEKPAIYLYPIEETEISVKLHFKGDLKFTYPEYNDGWNITAQPDGTLLNNADGKEYSYLFWEGNSDVKYDMSKGFVVKGTDTAVFLQEKLAYLGLTPKEYNEFIVYWLPKMQDNEFNLITFQGKAYIDNAVLDISPQPDSILRVFMAYKPLDEYIEIEEQELDTFTREGFTVVEWGGTCIG